MDDINKPTLKGRVIEQLRATGMFSVAEEISKKTEAEVYVSIKDDEHQLATWGVDWSFERDGYVWKRQID